MKLLACQLSIQQLASTLTNFHICQTFVNKIMSSENIYPYTVGSDSRKLTMSRAAGKISSADVVKTLTHLYNLLSWIAASALNLLQNSASASWLLSFLAI